MRIFLEFIAMVALAVGMNQADVARAADDLAEWTNDFSAEKEALVSTGRNAFFILEPGYQLVLEKEKERLVITVLNETKQVDGVETRIVEERETDDGQMVEVSRNYFAISKRTGNVYYFGEDVDIYKDGKVASHDGSWLSGVNGAQVWPDDGGSAARRGQILPGSRSSGRNGSGRNCRGQGDVQNSRGEFRTA